MPSTTPLTKSDLTEALRLTSRDIMDHVTKTQAHLVRRLDGVEEWLNVINTKLDAIMSGEVLVIRKQLHRLLQMLKVRGIELNEAEILAT